ncbi:MAG: LamG-like jellyroll fold domain-containing protein, partial [Limisphaerales bacterium]
MTEFGASYTEYAGQCAEFTGANTISIPANPSLDFTPIQQATFSLWILHYPNRSHIFGKRKSVDSNNYQLHFDGDELYFHGSPDGPGLRTDGNPFEGQRWKHLLITWDGWIGKVYINGKEFRVKNSENPFGDLNDVPLLIGGSSVYSKLVGKIDNFRIYRRALSATEVAQLYEYESTPPAPKPIEEWIDDGLVAYYPFDGDAKDASGNGNDGETNNTSFGPNRFGQQASAALFDGISDYVEISDAQTLQVNNFSISLWVLPGLADTSGGLFCKGSGLSGQIGYRMELDGGKPYLIWSRMGSITADTGYVTANNYLASSRWHQIIGVKNGSEMSIYIDGVPLVTKGGFSASFNNSSPVFIGAGNDSYTPSKPLNFLKGSIDEARLYNRALSATEVAQLYEYESTPPAPKPIEEWIDDGLVAYYPFDGDAKDASGNGNDGNGADLNYTADRFETPRAALENIEQKRFETSTEMIFDPEELTYSAWIKKNFIEAGGAVVALGNITTNRRSNLFIHSEVAEINRKSGVGYVGHGNDGFGGFEDSMDWSMVTVSKYGKLVSTYVNGKLTGQFELGLTQEQISSRIFIGWNGDEGHYNGETFLGRLDDVRIYNRALSATEVAQLYQYESVAQPELPGSLAFDDSASMEEVVAQQAQDTDGDGASDSYEQANGTDPSDSSSFPFLTADKVTKYYYDIPEGALNITLEMEFAQQSDANIYSLVGSEDFFAIRLGDGDGQWDRFMDVIRTAGGEVFATDGKLHNVEPISGELRQAKGVYSLKCIIRGDTFETIVDGNTIWKGQIISERLNAAGYVAPTMVEVSLLEPAFLHTKPRITIDLSEDTPVEEWIDDGLVAYYPFDGDAKDASGNGNDGEAGITEFGASYTEYAGQCAEFTGANTISIPANPSLDFTPIQQATFSLWILHYPNRSHIFGKRKSVDSNNYQLHFDGDELYFHGSPDGPGLRTDGNPFEGQRWKHLLITWDGWIGKVYINGKEFRVKNSENPFGDLNDVPLLIGGSSVYSKLVGKIDNFRIYRRALSATEVAQLYEYESTPPAPKPIEEWIDDGLVAYYPFDGDAKDASGNGNDGETNNTSFGPNRFGQQASAALFDGISDYVEISDAQTLQVNNFSISLWVLPGLADTSGGLFCKGSGLSGQIGYRMELDGGKPYLIWSRMGSITADTGYVTANNYLASSRWHQIIGVKNGSEMSIYIDGVPLVTKGGFSASFNNSSPVFIGAGNDSYTPSKPLNFLKGSIDEARLYNRALSATEVAQLYEYESTPPAPKPIEEWIDDGLVAYYPFDGDAKDASGNGNDGNGADLNYTADRFETPRAALENIEQKRFETSTEMIFDPEELTYSAWIKKNFIEAGGAVVALGNITTNRRSNLFIHSEVAEINRKSGVGYVGHGNDGFGGFEDSMDWSMVTVSKYGKLVSTYVNG